MARTPTGTLHFAMRAAQCLVNAPSSNAWPGLTITNAKAIVPATLSTPTTCAAATEGCVCSTSSISAGLTRNPLSLMASPSRVRKTNAFSAPEPRPEHDRLADRPAEDVLDLVPTKARVHRDGDRAQAAAGEEGREPSGEVRQPQGHAVPRANGKRAQPGSEPGRFVGERRVGDRAVAMEERRRRRVRVEERGEGGRSVHTLLLRGEN